MTARRRSGGRAARQAARVAAFSESTPYLTRRLMPFEVLGDEGLSTIEALADRLLEEVGVEVVDDPGALSVFADHGAVVDGTRVRFPEGMCRRIIQESAPARFTQHARNPARNVVIGDPHMVFAPAYGPPFVRDLESGRRYATIEDFCNFVRLTYMSPGLHHGGGTLCEPVDLPVEHRHLDMVRAHVLLSDKPFMGSVTSPARARDTVEMARIVFGSEFVEENTVLTSLCNANSPLTWDGTMLGSARTYAESNQATILAPFILAGAMAPVTVAAVATQTLAEAMAGIAFTQMVRPGAPAILGSFASSMSMQTGAPTFGTPEPALMLFVMAALARRLGVPFRSGGCLTASKVPDAQAAYESAATLLPTVLAGVNFVLHGAGWLEGGLVMGYEKFVLDADQVSMAASLVAGVDMSENGLAPETLLDHAPGEHYLGTQHTLANFETAFWTSNLADNTSFEQWHDTGGKDSVARAHETWRRLLGEYEPPALDESVRDELDEFVARRKSQLQEGSP
ncbi:MAG: trimethylamine methyltransferase family protein [Actinomycetota bacterium]